MRGSFNPYNDFKAAFLAEFYSVPIRTNIKNVWSARTYNPRDGSYQSYFYKQLEESEYFIPKLSAYEINYTTVTHLPRHVMSSLAAVNFESATAAAQ